MALPVKDGGSKPKPARQAAAEGHPTSQHRFHRLLTALESWFRRLVTDPDCRFREFMQQHNPSHLGLFLRPRSRQ
jgi:hypothetical protein